MSPDPLNPATPITALGALASTPIWDQLAPVDVLDLVNMKQGAGPERDRAAVVAAVEAVAASDGEVHIAAVRTRLRQQGHTMGDPHRLGATITALVRANRLVWDGRTRASGNTAQRNSSRPAKVYRLVRAK